MVVLVLMTSCQVSLKPNNGPLSAHTRMTPTATKNVTGRPDTWAVHLVSRVNHERDLVGLMVRGCYHSRIPSMFRTLRRVVWPPVDPALVDAGREGELAVARTPNAIVGLLAINPAAALVRPPDDPARLLTAAHRALFLRPAM